MGGRANRVLSLGVLLWGAACGLVAGTSARPGERAIAQRPSGTLTVFAAASLTDAFTQLGQKFMDAHPGVEVIVSFAGSQQLAQQLGQGAPGDVFASADEYQMQAVISSGRVPPDASRVFAHNRLVVIYPRDNPAALKTLDDLSRPGLRLIFAAPEVPAGRYAQDFMDAASRDPTFGVGFTDRVRDNVVSYEENVKAVLTKVVLGEADAGIVYTSDLSPGYAGQVGRLEIPPHLNVTARYLIAPLADGHHPSLAAQFIEYVLSPEGQAILAANGFVPLSPAPSGE